MPTGSDRDQRHREPVGLKLTEITDRSATLCCSG